jgi:hypothetical protein
MIGPMGRPKTGRSPQLNFVPTTQQMRAIHALTEERRTDDPRVTQSDVVRELVQRGLDTIKPKEQI